MVGKDGCAPDARGGAPDAGPEGALAASAASRGAAAVRRAGGGSPDARGGAPVSVRHVSFRHKGAPEGSYALDDVCLDVPAGQVVVLCGRSGCGKTTLTRLVNGLVPQFFEGDLWGEVRVGPTDGAGARASGGRAAAGDGAAAGVGGAAWAALDPSEEPIARTAALVGSVFQNPRSQFFNVDSTSELAFCCENMGWDAERIDAAVLDAVERFGLRGLLDRNLFKLSGGERQKIACASVSAHGPRVLVLDEPASNLDVRSIRMLADVIARWKAEGRTVVVAEHRLGYLMDVADRFVLLEEGRVAWEKSAAQLSALSDDQLHAAGLRSVRPVSFAAASAAAFAPPRLPAPARPSSAPARPFPASAHGRSGGRGLPTAAAGEGEDAPKAGAAKGDATAGLEVRSLRFAYGRSGKAAVDVEELSFPRGAVVGVLGDNGAGKSTFARCVCGLERGCEGEVAVGGRLCSNARRRRLCYLVMQDVNHQLFTESVREEVALSLRNRPRDPLRGEAAAPVVDAILEGLDLESLAERHPMALSGGQKQRVAIASAVAGERAVCVFDEPTSGLDWAHMLDTARNLRDLSARGVTSLVITHDPELVAQCCDHALLMEQGRAAWWGRLDDPQTARRVEGFFG